MYYQVRYISHREGHHSSHSGYDLLGKYLGTSVHCVDITHRYTRILPWRLATPFVRRSGVAHYGQKQFYHEWSAMLDMLRHRHAVYHVLYGDIAYRYLGWASGLRQNRVVATYHYPPEKSSKAIPNPDFLKRLDALVVVGRNQIDYFSQFVDRKRIYWVPLPVDTEYFVPIVQRIIPDRPLCLSVGTHLRDFSTLRQVAANLEGEAAFVIITSADNASYFDGLTNVSVRTGIPESELRSLYQTCTLFVQSLQDTTANIALLEAMACGTPTVVSDVGAISDYVDGQCVVLAPPRDADAMTQAILELLRDENKRQLLARVAREQAERFSFSAVAEKMQSVYEQVMENN